MSTDKKEIKSTNELIREVQRIGTEELDFGDICEDCQYDHDCMHKGCYILREAVKAISHGHKAGKGLTEMGRALSNSADEVACSFCKHAVGNEGCELMTCDENDNEMEGGCSFEWRGAKEEEGKHG